MKAIHINSSAPFFVRSKKEYSIDPYELYSTVLSALMWRKLNGEIKLVTDSVAYEYYKKLNLLSIWNEVEILIENDIEGINPLMFWAAGKLLALRETIAPVVMLDTDFIVWEKIDFSEKEIISAHREDLFPDVYPNFSSFNMRKGYTLNKNFNHSVLPCNTAFLFINDESFKCYYVNSAIEFMKSAEDCNDNLCYMVFAEQRMLSMCAEYLNFPIQVLLDKDNLFSPQKKFTHLWGAKRILKKERLLGNEFLIKCRERITEDFPDYSFIIKNIESIINKM